MPRVFYLAPYIRGKELCQPEEKPLTPPTGASGMPPLQAALGGNGTWGWNGAWPGWGVSRPSSSQQPRDRGWGAVCNEARITLRWRTQGHPDSAQVLTGTCLKSREALTAVALASDQHRGPAFGVTAGGAPGFLESNRTALQGPCGCWETGSA